MNEVLFPIPIIGAVDDIRHLIIALSVRGAAHGLLRLLSIGSRA